MPQVTLDVVSLDDKPLAGLTRLFEGSGGTIGRDEGNTLALPDPRRRVSRLHATISFPGDVPTITNSSTVLTIGVGGAQLESGQAVPLVPGMNLSIGPYVLVVRAELPVQTAPLAAAAPASEPAPPAAQASAQWAAPRAPSGLDASQPSPANAMGASDPMAQLLAAAPTPKGGDPLADLLSGLGPAAPAPMGATPPAQPVDDPLAGLLSSGPVAVHGLAGSSPAIGDPFAALGIGSGPGANAPRPPAADPLPVYSPPPAALIPEDFNPFELPSASSRNSADPLSSMLGGSGAAPVAALTQGEESIDALFAPAGGAAADGLLNARLPDTGSFGGAPGVPSSLLAQPENSDPLALFGASPPAQDGLLKPMRDDLAEIGGAYQPPQAIDPAFSFARAPTPPRPAAVAPTEPLQAPAMPAYPADALTRAFLAGANLPPTALPQGLTPEIMSMVGGLLRSATAGAIDMLAIRASIKREVQAQVTIISSERNNPLKFLLDADSVLHQFLGKTMRGFMRPDEAMKDAFNDLRAHELGVIAGTRAALTEVLTKFDPTVLGDRLIRGSLLEKALPAMRKTKLWDLYLERYAQVRREVEDDFQSVFGKAFVAAYEEEIARMKARTPDQRS